MHVAQGTELDYGAQNAWLQEAVGAEAKSRRIQEERVRLNSEDEAGSETEAAVRGLKVRVSPEDEAWAETEAEDWSVEISVSPETPRALKRRLQDSCDANATDSRERHVGRNFTFARQAFGYVELVAGRLQARCEITDAHDRP
jgi:hypothetical protein